MVVVEPRGTGMALFTLRAAEEVRAAQFGMAEGELDAEMVAIAKTIIAQRTGSFDPSFDASESSSQFRDATLDELARSYNVSRATISRLNHHE